MEFDFLKDIKEPKDLWLKPIKLVTIPMDNVDDILTISNSIIDKLKYCDETQIISREISKRQFYLEEQCKKARMQLIERTRQIELEQNLDTKYIPKFKGHIELPLRQKLLIMQQIKKNISENRARISINTAKKYYDTLHSKTPMLPNIVPQSDVDLHQEQTLDYMAAYHTSNSEPVQKQLMLYDSSVSELNSGNDDFYTDETLENMVWDIIN